MAGFYAVTKSKRAGAVGTSAEQAACRPHDHPLANRHGVPLQALAGEPAIMFARSNGPRCFDAVHSSSELVRLFVDVGREVVAQTTKLL